MRYRKQQISPDENDCKNSTYVEEHRSGGTTWVIKPKTLPKITPEHKLFSYISFIFQVRGEGRAGGVEEVACQCSMQFVSALIFKESISSHLYSCSF